MTKQTTIVIVIVIYVFPFHTIFIIVIGHIPLNIDISFGLRTPWLYVQIPKVIYLTHNQLVRVVCPCTVILGQSSLRLGIIPQFMHFITNIQEKHTTQVTISQYIRNTMVLWIRRVSPLVSIISHHVARLVVHWE